MPPEVPESVRGVLVNVRLGGREYHLLVTDRRILAVVVGTYISLPILAGFASLPISLGSRGAQPQPPDPANLDQLFLSHPKNYSIPIASITHAVLNGGIQWVTLPMLIVSVAAGDFRFEFSHSTLKKDLQALRYARDVLAAALPGRLEVKHV